MNGKHNDRTDREPGQALAVRPDGGRETCRVTKLMRFHGLQRVDTEEAVAGDIVALAGAGEATVGDTICPADQPDALPAIPIDEFLKSIGK